MKRIISLCFMLAVSLSMAAQTARHQIEVGVGGPFNPGIAPSVSELINGLKYTYDQPSVSESHVLNINVAYSYRVWNRLYAGVELGISPGTKIIREAYDDSSVTTNAVKHTCIIAMPRLKYQWLENQYLSLYSNVAAGVYADFERDAAVPLCFAWQVVPIGVSIGGSHLRFFAEVGVGNCCIARAGIQTLF